MSGQPFRFKRLMPVAVLLVPAAIAPLQAQAPRAGAPLPELTAAERELFERGREAFRHTLSVAEGLGPRFNLDGCAGCHSQPALGGTSPAVNPQFEAASRMGARNQMPPFLRPDGPVRVVRFRRRADGTPDGGVHSLFVISGRGDAPSDCNIAQEDFAAQPPGNLEFRIPTPVFGLGLMEAISDTALRANLASGAATKRLLGIGGRFNTSGNDGTIMRFGWKAQNKSIAIFSGEAYNVEMGVTNELFPHEREDNAACVSTLSPEDRPDPATGGPETRAGLFAAFMRLLAPPRAQAPTPAITRGSSVFERTGCAACHTPTLTTAKSANPALNEKPVRLYSDLALHRMGQRLNDGIQQGDARGDEWRTAPLWGLGNRLFYLHDGRSRDLEDAIRQHDSPGSEARLVIGNFNALTAEERADLLAFLRSL